MQDVRPYSEFLAAAAKRRARARKLRERGWTHEAIGSELGISKQRVGQLLRTNGHAK